MSIYIYIYTHIYVYLFKYVYIYIYIFIYIYIRTINKKMAFYIKFLFFYLTHEIRNYFEISPFCDFKSSFQTLLPLLSKIPIICNI